MSRSKRLAGPLAIAGSVAILSAVTPVRADVILQYFESRWTTIERRMPDIFMAGYQHVWVPPPGLADSGAFSVGYDVFDRFNLGTPDRPTLYGTENGFDRMSQEFSRAGINLFIDTVLNHNGFRDLNTPGFVDAGDYPGFVTTLPGDIDGDFHSSFAGGDLDGRLAGLIDIDQGKNHQFVRHPVPGNPDNIPNETPDVNNRRFYPDTNPAGGEVISPNGWNLTNPNGGDAYKENATGLTTRYLRYMIDIHGVKGFRLDATKHMPTWYFNSFYDPAVHETVIDPVSGGRNTPFSFGENFTGDFDLLNAYVRKDGFGNRDTLDFPLFFAMQGVFDQGGLGDMRTLENASYDGSDGNANDGSRGVLFAGSHDTFGAGQFNGFSNLPHAHIMSRTGFPLVYYNAKEFGNGRDFPKDGRGDALGNFGVNVLPILSNIHTRYAFGPHRTRWIDQDVYWYERENSLLVGINDRGDSGFDTRTGVQTGFHNIDLWELTGNAADPLVDPNNDIPEVINVPASGIVDLKVPRNTSSAGFHGRGYVMYGLRAPAATLTVENAASVLPPDPPETFEPQKRLTPITVVTADTINLKIQTDTTGGKPLDDNSIIKVDWGRDLNGTRIVGGRFHGFSQFDSRSDSQSGGTGTYTINVDATGLEEGYHYIQTATFRRRLTDEPPVFDLDKVVVLVDRVAPTVQLAFPAQTGTNDIQSSSYEAVVKTHYTANSVHILSQDTTGLSDAQVVALVSGANKAQQRDRTEWRGVLSGLTSGLLTLTVVAFEETGRYSVTRFNNIGVNVPPPNLLIGVDTNASASATTFASVPATITDSSYDNDFVVRVDTNNGGSPISFPGDYTVELQVDNGPWIPAQAHDPGLLPPVGILVEDDQDTGDGFDEFRFVWKGYSTGNHTFRARGTLTTMGATPNQAIATTNVPFDTVGPDVAITTPTPPSETINNPATISVAGTFDAETAFAQVFMEIQGQQQLLQQYDAPTPGSFSITRPVGSYQLTDVVPPGLLDLSSGDFTVTLNANTGAGGTGIQTLKTSEWEITGLPPAPPLLPTPAADGDASEMLSLGRLVAVSPVDGGSGNASPADFGPDGSLTEMKATIRDGALWVVVRGDFFGANEDSTGNMSAIFVDVNSGSGAGVKNVSSELNDSSDGLRGEISNLGFLLGAGLTGTNGFDAVFAITTPSVGAGYTLGTDGVTGGTFTNFQYQQGITWSYDPDCSTDPAAPGTTKAGTDAFEVRFPLDLLGNPDPSKIRLVAVTAADSGFPSPNALPEITDPTPDPFTATQTITTLGSLGSATAGVRINEVFVGLSDGIELFNPTGGAVDLGGWALRMGDSANVRRDYVFPNGTSIAANGYLLVSDLGKSNPPSDAPPILYAGFNIPWDESRGGSIALVDPLGVGKDYVDWRNAANDQSSAPVRNVPYGTAYTGDAVGAASSTLGHSLARNQSGADTNAASDWDATSGVDATAPTFLAANVDGVADGDKDGLGDGCETSVSATLLAGGATITNVALRDSDGDGLLDGEETPTGCTSARLRVADTSPRDRDSDNDGWIDGLEMRRPDIFRNGPTVMDTGFTDADADGLPSVIDPNDADPDTDGDGIGDAYEVAYGTDPNDPDDFPTLGNVNGDLDGSNNPIRDVADVISLANANVGLGNLVEPWNADLNRDGVVDLNDVILLANHNVGLAILPTP